MTSCYCKAAVAAVGDQTLYCFAEETQMKKREDADSEVSLP